MKWRLIAQGQLSAPTLAEALGEAISSDQFDNLDVAVAYATLQGVKALELALNGIKKTSRWVVGLDDAISQPEAIEYLISLNGSKVRLASMSPQKRFHPKLYCSWSSNRDDQCVTAIGSGNMTLNGLRNNGETAVLLTAESNVEVAALRAQWQAMWDLGRAATSDAIEAYRKAYSAARKQRRKISNLGVAPPEPKPNAPVEVESSFDGNPTSANHAWLEAGSPSAGGRDLELPRHIVPFFELKRSPTTKTFRMQNGEHFYLRFTERTNNQMWRLMFNRNSIHAATGRETLRPVSGGNRSDLGVVFRKSDGAADYDVQMVAIGSPEHENIIARSRRANGLFHTRNPGGRNFGFF